MKQIFLAGKLKRILATLIDYVILFATSALIFFALVYPLTFNASDYKENSLTLLNRYEESEIYMVTVEDGTYYSISDFDSCYRKLENLSSCTVLYKNENVVVNTLERTYHFYTQKYQTFTGKENYSLDGFKNSVLKIGTTDSNIASFDETNYKITVIDNLKIDTALSYMHTLVENTAELIHDCNYINDIAEANRVILRNVFLLIIPVVVVNCFILNFLIPAIAPNGQTIGKFIFKLAVLDYDGYVIKKGKYFIRWLIYLLELVLGIATFGGVLLISYTMFLFAKRHRCIHDFAAGSVVIDNRTSVYFSSREEEAYIAKKLEEKNKPYGQ